MPFGLVFHLKQHGIFVSVYSIRLLVLYGTIYISVFFRSELSTWPYKFFTEPEYFEAVFILPG